MKKLVRITTVPLSLEKLLEDQPRYFSQFYAVTLISSDPARLYKLGKAQGVATHSIPLTRTISPFQDLKCLFLLVHYLRKEKPDIVHTHTPKAGIIGMLASYIAGVPIKMHTVAGLPLMEAKGGKRILLTLVEKITYWCADKVYPNARGLKDFILAHGYCASAKLKLLGPGSSNGIDSSYFDPAQFSKAHIKSLRNALQIKPSDFVFCFVGRLVGDKGVNELVNAFVSLSKKHSQIKLLLVGPEEVKLDPLLPHTRTQITQHKDIIAVGYQQDIRPYLALSNQFVFPSYREGFPNVVLQAAAMEVACIVSDIIGCNEIIEHQVNGWIVPPKDQNTLLATMETAFLGQGTRERFKKRLRNHILSTFERKHFWTLLQKEYQFLLKHV